MNSLLLYQSIPLLLKGASISLYIAFFATIIGLLSGTIIALLIKNKIIFLSTIGKIYVSIIRGTPLLVQIACMHYAIIPFFGLSLSPITTAIIAFGINSSAYVSQTVYSGISTVSKDQSEAAFVLGFTKIQTAWYIVLPQAIKAMLPALTSEIMTLIKDSSLASIIGVSELYKEARNIISVTYEVKTMYFLVACIYFIMTFSVLLLSRYIEYRLKKDV